MDLTFQVHVQYCSLQHQTLLSPPDTSTDDLHFSFGLVASFCLEVLLSALCSSPGAYWTPSHLGGSSSSVISFCLFILLMGSHRKNTGVVCHSLLQWTMICQRIVYCVHPFWVALHGMTHSFIELYKCLCYDKTVTPVWGLRCSVPGRPVGSLGAACHPKASKHISIYQGQA